MAFQNTLQNTQHVEILIDLQKNIFENGQFCDVIIVCNGSEIRVHRAMLANASEFFEKIILDHAASEIITILLAPEFAFNTIFKLMEFIYIGSTHVQSKVECDAFQEACHILQIKNLAPLSPWDNEIPTNIRKQSEDEPEAIVEVVNMVEPATNIMETAEDQHSEVVQYYEDDIEEGDEMVEQQSEELDLQFLQQSVHGQEETTEHELDPNQSIMQDQEEDINIESLLNDDPEPPMEEHSPPVAERKQPIEVSLPKPATVSQPRRVFTVARNRIQKPEPPKEKNENITNALDAIFKQGISLREAGERFSVPKNMLWSRFKRFQEENPGLINVVVKPSTRMDAMQAIEKGESVKNIFSKYNLPLVEIVKMKQRVVERQNVIPMAVDKPTTSSIKVRTVAPSPKPAPTNPKAALEVLHAKANEYKIRLQKAINGCRVGMGLDEASTFFSIPASTLYRNIKHMKLQHIEDPDAQQEQ